MRKTENSKGSVLGREFVFDWLLDLKREWVVERGEAEDKALNLNVSCLMRNRNEK